MSILGKRHHAKVTETIPSRDTNERFYNIRRIAYRLYLQDTKDVILTSGNVFRLSIAREIDLLLLKLKSHRRISDSYQKDSIYARATLDLINKMVVDARSLSNGTLEDYKKESNTMTKKNEVEKINDTEKEELVTFITNMRQSGESFWWMGIYTGPNDRPKVISTSMRGFFKDMFWRPLETERQSCCDEIEGSITNGVSAFILTQHCASQDHVRNLINSRTEEELYAEYQYMLNETLDALVDGFGDD